MRVCPAQAFESLNGYHIVNMALGDRVFWLHNFWCTAACVMPVVVLEYLRLEYFPTETDHIRAAEVVRAALSSLHTLTGLCSAAQRDKRVGYQFSTDETVNLTAVSPGTRAYASTHARDVRDDPLPSRR